MTEAVQRRRAAVRDFKRATILEAAKRIFADLGLEGASIRAIAKEAGYTSGAIYAYFKSKEAMYAAILRDSGEELQAIVTSECHHDPKQALRRKVMAIYQFYCERPRDLELSLYLARGVGPKGLTREFNRELNELLLRILGAIGNEMSRIRPTISEAMLKQIIALLYGAIIGVILLTNTKRIFTLGAKPELIMRSHIDCALTQLENVPPARP